MLACRQQSLKVFVRLTCLTAGIKDDSLQTANSLKIKVNYPLFLKKSKNNMFQRALREDFQTKPMMPQKKGVIGRQKIVGDKA